MEKKQDFGSHTRWHAPFHFVLAPFMLLHLVFTIVRFVQHPGWDRGEFVLLSMALVIMTLLVRVNPLAAQDRIIRLEEQLRFRDVLPAELADQSMKLKRSDYIALRFAPDEELPELVSKIVSGELTGQKEIKMAIKNWRPDHFRV